MANLKDKPTNAEKKAFKNKVKKMKDKDNKLVFTDAQIEQYFPSDDADIDWQTYNDQLIASLKLAPKG